jgi:tetratricopeptide (TPR) repeat protein
MKALEPPDSHHLSAAEGWLGLGDWKEAAEELKKIPAERRHHPEALEVLREIFAQAGRWDVAADVAGHLVTIKPEAPDAWVALAYATRRKDGGGLKPARQILTRAQRRFPKEPIIAYNLACYECQLGNEQAALKWLGKALATGRAREIRSMALLDRDLEPLWPKIRKE